MDAAAASKPSGESLNKRGSPLPLKKHRRTNMTKFQGIKINKPKKLCLKGGKKKKANLIKIKL